MPRMLLLDGGELKIGEGKNVNKEVKKRKFFTELIFKNSIYPFSPFDF